MKALLKFHFLLIIPILLALSKGFTEPAAILTYLIV